MNTKDSYQQKYIKLMIQDILKINSTLQFEIKLQTKLKMTSNQKQAKLSSKFNYLMQEDNIEKLSKYDKLSFSPKNYRRTYEKTINQLSVEKEKENQSQNVSKCIKSNMKGYASNTYQQQSSNQKHGLISFGKNRNVEKPVSRQQSAQNHHAFRDQVKIKQQGDKREYLNRQRHKSFGSIGLKKTLFEPRDSINEGVLQFSPYQEETMMQHDGTKFTRSRIQLEPYVSGLDSRSQNLLIYELQQQQLIVRKQLKEYEYQNELLRQRVDSLEKQNHAFAQMKEQHTIELQQRQLSYQRKVQSLSLDMRELQEQNAIWKLENEQILAEINSDKTLIDDLENELHLLAVKNEQLQALIDSKDQTIVGLKTKIQLMQVDQLGLIECGQNKRRKSLDLATQARKMTHQQKFLHYQAQADPREQQQELREHYAQLSKTSNIGRLMNRNSNHGQSHLRYKDMLHQSSGKQSRLQLHKHSGVQKYLNFIDSVRSMYTKVTGQDGGELKEVWKWLKMVTHEYQAFAMFYTLKDSIMAVVEDMEGQMHGETAKDELSFMEKECYKIMNRLANVVLKQQ